METGRLYKLAAFANSPDGGNPAGVWIGEKFPDDGIMQGIAAEVGFSETAFVIPTSGQHRVVRYFSPEIEVPFCGHATIATGVFLGETEGDGTYILKTAVGEVPVSVRIRNGVRVASLTSVEPKYVLAQEGLVDETLSILGWRRHDLDPSIRPAIAYAGVWHLVIAVSEAERLARLEFDFENLKTVMLREDLTTLQLVWRESVGMFHSRNPFPVGGVFEDPATGAAAAALGGYLRAVNLIKVPTTINIRQGEAMGRPSRIIVQIPKRGGIVVSGTAVRI